MQELKDIRADLDRVDRELVRLFEKRMALCAQVAEYKIAHGMEVLDASREDQVLSSRAAMLENASLTEDVQALFRTLMALSRAAQQRQMTEAHNHA